MPVQISKQDKTLLLFHILFAVFCFIVLLLPISINIRLTGLVLIYTIGLYFFAYKNEYQQVKQLFWFLVPLSIFQVFPDAFLATVLQVLYFPTHTSFPSLGGVPLYMALLWIIPLFITTYTGLRLKEEYSDIISYSGVALLACLIFTLSEETLWILPVWEALQVTLISHVAIYIIIPEIILGLTTFQIFQVVKDRAYYDKFISAFFVMLVYLGSASFFYLIVEYILVI